MVSVGLFQVLWQEHRIFSGTVAVLFMNRGTERRLGVYVSTPAFHLIGQPALAFPHPRERRAFIAVNSRVRRAAPPSAVRIDHLGLNQAVALTVLPAS